MSHSELECFVLGLVWQLGPIAAYGVRQRMQGSPSRQWSASTGAIYPALRRLEGSGLLRGREAAQGRRRRREYEVTEAGLAVLRAWVGPPLGPETVTVAFDPLRTRARFLGALAPEARGAWVEGAIGVLDEVEKQVRGWAVAHGGGDPFLESLTRHALLETEARRRWLEGLLTMVRGDAR